MSLVVTNYQQNNQFKSQRRYISIIHEYILKNDLFGLKFELNEIISKHDDEGILFKIDSINTETGRTALFEAAANGYYEIVKYLLEEHQCNVNKRTVLGKSTPLHVAVELDHRQVAIYLILNGADIDAQDKYGSTALHLTNTLTIAKMLQKFNANCLIRNSRGYQPSYAYKIRSEADGKFDQVVYNFLSDWEYSCEIDNARHLN